MPTKSNPSDLPYDLRQCHYYKYTYSKEKNELIDNCTRVWNSLPDSLRTIPYENWPINLYNKFNKACKTHLLLSQ